MSIVIYSKSNCPWCVKAKELLKQRDLAFTELMFEIDFLKEDLKRLIGDRPLTVPQVFIDGKLIGGYEALAAHLSPDKF